MKKEKSIKNKLYLVAFAFFFFCIVAISAMADTCTKTDGITNISVSPCTAYSRTWDYEYNVRLCNDYNKDVSINSDSVFYSTANSSFFRKNTTCSLDENSTMRCAETRTLINSTWEKKKVNGLINGDIAKQSCSDFVYSFTPSDRNGKFNISILAYDNNGLVSNYTLDPFYAESANGTIYLNFNDNIVNQWNNATNTSLFGTPSYDVNFPIFNVSGNGSTKALLTSASSGAQINNIDYGGSDFFYSMWVNCSTFSTNTYIFNHGSGANQRVYFYVSDGATGKVQAYVKGASGTLNTGDFILQPNKQYNLIMNKNASGIFVFANTNYVGNASGTAGTVNPNLNIIISGATAGSAGVACLIDEFKIGNKSLNEFERQCIFNKGESNCTYAAVGTSIIFNKQLPLNITNTNLLSQFLNISYNITSSINLILNQIKMFGNVTRDGVLSFIWNSGIGTTMNFSKAYTSNSSSTFYWMMDHDLIYPIRDNFDQSMTENMSKLNSSIGASSDWIKVRFYNISDARNFNYLLINFFNTSGLAEPIFYCNSSYSVGNPATSPNCINFYTLFPRPKDASFDGESYFIISLGISNGKIGGLNVTNPSYFAFPGGNGWSYNYINNYTLLDSTRVSANNGNSWTNLSVTPDMHVHQFTNTSLFTYYICANDSNSNYVCSSPVVQNIGIELLPPSSPHVINPIAGTYNGTIFINYTQSVSETGQIVYYSIDLLDSGENFIQSISANNTLKLNYTWNSTAVVNGNYIIEVTAHDNQSMTSSDISNVFTISNPLPPPPPQSTADAITGIGESIIYFILLFIGAIVYFMSLVFKDSETQGSIVLKFFSVVFISCSLIFASANVIMLAISAFMSLLISVLFFIDLLVLAVTKFR